MKTDITSAAAALGRKGGKTTSKAKAEAAKANGAKGGRPFQWHPAPRRGCKNPLSADHRYTIVRLSDRMERFTDRRPRPEVMNDLDVMVWDNRSNCEVR